MPAPPPEVDMGLTGNLGLPLIEGNDLTSAAVSRSSRRHRCCGLVRMSSTTAASTRVAAEILGADDALAGEMPPDIEEVFTRVGLSLFPAREGDLSMDCSCPDWSVPCKHLAAVFYLLAESFDDDPFAVMAWRGRDREDLLAAVSALPGGGGRVAADEPEDAAVPLGQCLDAFWVMPAGIPRRAAAPALADALLDQLPQLELTVRRRPLVELLRPAYLRPDAPE